MSYTQYWIDVRRIVEADPELIRLGERMKKARPAGSPTYRAAERAYFRRRNDVEDKARHDVTAAYVDQERADKAAYMREYRAGKRAIREAVDAARKG
jgi:hypothetical protein